MTTFPPDRTPTPAQKNIRLGIFAMFIIAALSIFCIYGFSETERNVNSVPRKFYIKVEKDEPWLKKFLGDPIAVFTLVLTGATIGLFIATKKLWVATDRLAALAEDQGKITNKLFLLDQRPWIMCEIKLNSGLSWTQTVATSQ